MNKEVRSYTIGVIGFERSERHVLRRMVATPDDRLPSFKPFDKNRGGCPHLILVDADRPSAIQAWNRFRRANAHRACFSPVFVGRNLTDLPCPEPYAVQRPIRAAHLFAVLDQAVTEVHGFRPGASTLGRIVALVPHEMATSLQTTTVLAASADATPDGSDGSSEARRSPEVSILVVDDSLPVRVQMRGALASIASRLDFAETGERALELIDAHPYSIIFLDGALPNEDAYEICGRIKKHPLQQQAVAVMLTSSSSPADRVMGMLAGFDNYLVKPIQRAMFNNLAAELARPAAAI